MKTLILALLLLTCSVGWAEEKYFTVKPTKNKCEMVGKIYVRYPIELEYSKLIICGADIAFEEWLENISAKDFFDKYCVGTLEVIEK